jgi:hypothetical protein
MRSKFVRHCIEEPRETLIMEDSPCVQRNRFLLACELADERKGQSAFRRGIRRGDAEPRDITMNFKQCLTWSGDFTNS